MPSIVAVMHLTSAVLTSTEVALAASGRLQVLPLISREQPFERSAQAHRILDDDLGDVLQLVLTFGAPSSEVSS